ERHPWPCERDAHALIDVRLLATIPLPQREVGDLMALRGQPLCEVAIPALGAADRVREQAVVDDADSHGGKACQRRPPSRRRRRYRACCRGPPFLTRDTRTTAECASPSGCSASQSRSSASPSRSTASSL